MNQLVTLASPSLLGTGCRRRISLLHIDALGNSSASDYKLVRVSAHLHRGCPRGCVVARLEMLIFHPFVSGWVLIRVIAFRIDERALCLNSVLEAGSSLLGWNCRIQPRLLQGGSIGL